MLPVILLIFLYPSTGVADHGNVTCPCHIYVNENDTRVADCQDKNLTTIPDCVPNSTQLLDLGFNNLQYSPRQFQRFGNLRALKVGSNSAFAAHTESFKCLSSLEKLYLDHTDLTYLNGKTFVDQSVLKELNLRGNVGHLHLSQSLFDHLGNLEILLLGGKYALDFTIPNFSFVRLSSLRELDLSVMSTLLLQNTTFYKLSTLKFLDLGNPLISLSLPDEVFKPLISLEELHLEGLCSVLLPSFDCTTIDDRLRHAPSLKRLYIDKSLISHLGKGFLSLKNLQELYLVDSMVGQCCEIKCFSAEYFIYLKNSPLTKLVISFCNIVSLRSEWFQYLTELKEISLSVIRNTCIYSVFWKYFSDDLQNTSIPIIRLSFTSSFIYFSPSPFYAGYGFSQTRVTSLELTDTSFCGVDDYGINMLPISLRYLNLTRNYLLYFGVENLKYLESLETLDLSNQVALQYDHCGASEYSHQTELKQRDFSLSLQNEYYNVRRINPFKDRIQKRPNITETKCLSLPYRLKYLDVSKSGLLCNMVSAFCGSNNSLKILNASVQRDRSCFETRSFWSFVKNLAKLVELNLNGNLITEIPYGTFSGLYKLRTLLLNDNRLLELSFNVNDLISLETLDLAANGIEYVSNSFTSQIDDISRKTNLTLDLSINHLVCNCKQLDFVSWLMVTQVISNKNKLNCTFENDIQINIGRISHARDILKYKCIRNDVTIGCTVTFWGLNFVLGGLAYIWHKRQKLRYLVSFGRRTLNPYHPIEDCYIEMEYDVYISYEGDFNVTRDMTLRDFLIYTILPGLERQGVRVMIREELDAGRNLYEVISQTVRRSKKVVAFLTNGYCQDIWNVFEFNQAVMEGIYTNRQIAIPVLFESLRRDKVKEEIREFLQMEPVHKYSPELSDRAFIDFLYERIRDTRQFG